MSFIIDINQDQFLEEVVEKSKTTPVIVDFWAPWCGPCKQLTPLLESVVNKKNGKIILAKINVDENQGIASQLNIQSIPTVYGFVDGKPIDAFQGSQPESKIEEIVNYVRFSSIRKKKITFYISEGLAINNQGYLYVEEKTKIKVLKIEWLFPLF